MGTGASKISGDSQAAVRVAAERHRRGAVGPRLRPGLAEVRAEPVLGVVHAPGLAIRSCPVAAPASPCRSLSSRCSLLDKLMSTW